MHSWGQPGIRWAKTVLLVCRAGKEERTLQAELPGYAEDVRETRYQLLRVCNTPRDSPHRAPATRVVTPKSHQIQKRRRQ